MDATTPSLLRKPIGFSDLLTSLSQQHSTAMPVLQDNSAGYAVLLQKLLVGAGGVEPPMVLM